MQDLIPKLFPGLGAMANLHPLLVHFPLALFTAFILTEMLGLLLRRQDIRAVASGMLYLGTLGALAAVIAGFGAADTVSHTEEVHDIMERHERFGLAVMSLGAILSAWRIVARGHFSRLGEALHLLLAFSLLVTMAIGGDLGGLMVYKYGVAVQAVQPPDHHHDHAAAPHAEQTESGSPEGEPVVVPAPGSTPDSANHVDSHQDEPAPATESPPETAVEPAPANASRGEGRGRTPRERRSRPRHEHPPGTPPHRH